MFQKLFGCSKSDKQASIPSGQTKMKVAVLGAGYSGASIALSLDKDKFDVTLIDQKPNFENKIALYHVLVQPDSINKNSGLHETYLKRARVIIGHIQAMTPNEVITDNETIPFDYAVIATGSRYEVNFAQPSDKVVYFNRMDDMVRSSPHLKDARVVSVIGGGASGLEAAAEIKEKFPNKRVILLHSRDKLLSNFNEEAQEYAEKFARKHNIELLLNSRVSKVSDGGAVEVNNGTEKIDSDFALICMGWKLNNEFIKSSSELKTALNADGSIAVNEYFQVKNHPHIFAIGDIAGTNEQKIAKICPSHVKYVMRNLDYFAYGINRAKPYRPKQYESQCIVLGSRDAILCEEKKIKTGFAWAKLKRSFSLEQKKPDKVE